MFKKGVQVYYNPMSHITSVVKILIGYAILSYFYSINLQGNAIQYITMKWNAMQSNGCHINVTQHSLFTVAGNLVLVAGTLFL